MKKNSLYLVFTIMLFVVLLLPPLVRDGMFFDGVTYSAISKNMADGIGSFFIPHYTKTLYPEFYEHPPLAFILQSYFFKIFGNAFYTERIYCFLMALLTAIGIGKTWILMSDRSVIRSYYWFPVLIWLTVPVVSWSFRNNMLENTMGLFTIAAVYFILKALRDNKFIYVVMSGVFIVLAILSKGPVGLFPIITPLCFALVFNGNKRSYYQFLYLLLTLSLFSLALLVVFPDLKSNLMNYFDQQLLPALTNKREITTESRFQIILDLFLELGISLLLVAYYLYSKWRQRKEYAIGENQNFRLFILIAICASWPLIISLKQSRFYFVPSIPFYALAFGFLLVDFIKTKLDTLSEVFLIWLKRLSFAVIGIVVVYSFLNFGKISRDEDMLNDVYTISKYLPEGTIISTNRALCSDWPLIAYLSRVGYISLDCDMKHEYYLVEKGKEIDVPELYKAVDLNLKKYTILRDIGE